MKLLRNINPLGYIDLPVIGRMGEYDDETGPEPGVGCLVPGEEFKVPDKVAGVAPHWRPATKDDQDAIDRGHVATQTGEDGGLEVWDLGSGLLAQVGNYELVEDEQKGA